MSTTEAGDKLRAASSRLSARNLKLETRSVKRRSMRGVSLVELIVFVVVVSVGVAGVLLALNMSTRASADPLVQKQALAVAEAILEEVALRPLTYCDPDDVNATTALTAAACTGGAGGANDESRTPLGAEAGETRTGAATPYDNVSDYNGLAISPITDLTGAAIPNLAGYSAAITVAQEGVPAAGGASAIPAAAALLISVTVTGPGSTTVRLDGYRTRYAPNALP